MNYRTNKKNEIFENLSLKVIGSMTLNINNNPGQKNINNNNLTLRNKKKYIN